MDKALPLEKDRWGPTGHWDEAINSERSLWKKGLMPPKGWWSSSSLKAAQATYGSGDLVSILRTGKLHHCSVDIYKYLIQLTYLPLAFPHGEITLSLGSLTYTLSRYERQRKLLNELDEVLEPVMAIENVRPTVDAKLYELAQLMVELLGNMGAGHLPPEFHELTRCWSKVRFWINHFRIALIRDIEGAADARSGGTRTRHCSRECIYAGFSNPELTAGLRLPTHIRIQLPLCTIAGLLYRTEAFTITNPPIWRNQYPTNDTQFGTSFQIVSRGRDLERAPAIHACNRQRVKGKNAALSGHYLLKTIAYKITPFVGGKDHIALGIPLPNHAISTLEECRTNGRNMFLMDTGPLNSWLAQRSEEPRQEDWHACLHLMCKSAQLQSKESKCKDTQKGALASTSIRSIKNDCHSKEVDSTRTLPEHRHWVTQPTGNQRIEDQKGGTQGIRKAEHVKVRASLKRCCRQQDKEENPNKKNMRSSPPLTNVWALNGESPIQRNDKTHNHGWFLPDQWLPDILDGRFRPVLEDFADEEGNAPLESPTEARLSNKPGVWITTPAQIAPVVQLGATLRHEALAVLTLGRYEQAIPASIDHCEITYRAIDTEEEIVLLNGHLFQFGVRKIRAKQRPTSSRPELHQTW
jgi:hypothetical protein